MYQSQRISEQNESEPHLFLPLPYQSNHILSWYKDDGNLK